MVLVQSIIADAVRTFCTWTEDKAKEVDGEKQEDRKH